MVDGPAGRIVADSAASFAVSDGRGRRICFRRVSALDRLRLFKALGHDLAQNAPYLGMALLAVSVMAIDDVPVPPPVTENQLEILVQRLGDDGLGAIADALADEFCDATELATAGN
jgi:hypothetical protein